jgi:hypothetical protein
MSPHLPSSFEGVLRPISRKSPEAPGEASCASVDATLPLDELIQRLGNVLVFCRVPHHPRPFASGALIDLFRIRSAQDGPREGFVTH